MDFRMSPLPLVMSNEGSFGSINNAGANHSKVITPGFDKQESI